MQNLIENKNLLIEALKNVLVVNIDSSGLLFKTVKGGYFIRTETAEFKQQVLDFIISLAIQNNLGHIAIHKNSELKRIDGKPLAETSLVYYPKTSVNVLNNGAKNIYEVALNNFYAFTPLINNSSTIQL
jgi:hypothetical protein